MIDRELMALAAKAAGAKFSDYSERTPDHWQIQHADGVWRKWSPLTDDGDALRLAFTLNIHIGLYGEGTGITSYILTKSEGAEIFHEDHVYDLASVRRAIVRAAAFIGSKMP